MKFALLLDGGFVLKRLRSKLSRHASESDVLAECARIRAHPRLDGHELLRIYWYDAPPAKDSVRNPIDGTKMELAGTAVYSRATSLLDRLELTPDFSLRLGDLVARDWKLRAGVLKSIAKNPRLLEASDLEPDLKQKGVDLRIGLDIARLALRQLVDVIVVVTGDSDIVPAFKFARREGVRVYLDHLEGAVKRDLMAHVDFVL
ncbi:MAG: NYN domain-containing protein, partial [Planctomycetes bacterium]|nr:NYN domain-containing protein [Planctomycetota bacterium]